MAWIYLILAGLLEVAWAIGLKYSQGWTRFWPSVFTATAIVTSLLLLSQAMKSLPIGTAYAIWTGIGTIGVVVFGMVWLEEPRDTLRLFCIALIAAGIIGLKFTSPH